MKNKGKLRNITKVGLGAAMLVCVVPYLPAETVKIATAAAAVKRIGRRNV